MDNYDADLRDILSNQYQRETAIRFKDLKNGDCLVIRDRDKLMTEHVKCGYTNGMYKLGNINIIFDIENWALGYTCMHGYQWSLDMFEYKNKTPYVVDLI